MDEIRVKAYLEDAKPGRLGLTGKPAGWVVCDMDSGKRIGLDIRYATEEAAKQAIPGLLKARAEKLQHREAQDAARAAGPTEADAPARRYTTVHHAAFGDGRVYDDQPGATQYDDGSGRYGVQIWDNS